MSENNSESRMAGVSVRVNGVTHGAQAPAPHVVAEKIEPTVGRTKQANEVNLFRHFDEQDLGDLSGVEPFADSYEIQAAMRDPRYQRSEAYRKTVSRRLMAGRGSVGA